MLDGSKDACVDLGFASVSDTSPNKADDDDNRQSDDPSDEYNFESMVLGHIGVCIATNQGFREVSHIVGCESSVAALDGANELSRSHTLVRVGYLSRRYRRGGYRIDAEGWSFWRCGGRYCCKEIWSQPSVDPYVGDSTKLW